MPAPSPSWNLVRVFGTWRNLDGSPKKGVYKVSIPVKVTNATDNSAIPAGTFATGILSQDAGNPSLDIMVPSTDDPDVQEVGWQVSVEVTFADKSKSERLRIDVPYADRPVSDGGTGSGVNLRGLVAPDLVPIKDVHLKVGVPGGIALLDGKGNALNADGQAAFLQAIDAASSATASAASASTSAGTASSAAATATAAASVATAPTDGVVAAKVNDGASQTRAALASVMGGDIASLVPTVAGKVAKGDVVLNVKDYGAKGDGVTNDSPAIQAALNAATSGTTVRIPRGTYRIAQEMQLTVSGVTIDATGATLRADWGGTGSGDFVMLANGRTGDTPTGYTGVGNITLVGGIWDARGHVNNVSYSSPFAFAHAHGVTFRDVTLRNVRRGHGIDLTACRSAKFIGCRFEGYTDTGDPRLTEAIQVDISSTASTFPRFGAYDSTPCDDVAVIGCSFTDSADCGPWPRAVGSHNARTDRPMTNVRVQGCYMKVTDGAVRAYNWSRFSITGNTIDGAAVQVYAINAATPSEDTKDGSGTQTNASAPINDGIIANNVIRGSANDGIIVIGYTTSGIVSGLTISGNVIAGQTSPSGRYGIRLATVDSCSIVGNRVSGSPAESIRVDSGSNNVVVGENTTRGGNSHGVMVDNTSGCVVVGNVVIDAGAHGISLSGVTATTLDNSVRSNYVSGCSRVTANCVGIRVNNNTNASVVGNTVRKGTASPQYGFQVASGAAGTYYLANDFRLSGVTASINDVGTGSLTTAGSLT